jgi:hypothetical protein
MLVKDRRDGETVTQPLGGCITLPPWQPGAKLPDHWGPSYAASGHDADSADAEIQR